MSLQEKLEVLEEQYSKMIKFRALCNGMKSTINYSSLDFDREGELLQRIKKCKNDLKIREL
tara:strand:- start:165 stop:347 length:183 start_codon:yes stop_codon:yes gene_type:complete